MPPQIAVGNQLLKAQVPRTRRVERELCLSVRQYCTVSHWSVIVFFLVLTCKFCNARRPKQCFLKFHAKQKISTVKTYSSFFCVSVPFRNAHRKVKRYASNLCNLMAFCYNGLEMFTLLVKVLQNSAHEGAAALQPRNTPGILQLHV